MKYVHELDANIIITILKDSAFATCNQSITSSETNTYSPQYPNESLLEVGENTSGSEAFADLKFDSHVVRVLDIGGGKFDSNQHYMATRGIELLVWDPYNRPFEHNSEILTAISQQKAQAVTSMSVLNVIPEVETRLAHIYTEKMPC